MIVLGSAETELVGQWHFAAGKVVADATCERIERLIANHLQELARDESGWEVIYRDPDDGRLWELIYPHGEMHGGGPPTLRAIAENKAKLKYNTLLRS